MIEAVVFDFDGLIRDTETYEFYSFQEILREYDVELPLELYCKRIGGHAQAFDPYNYLQECTGLSLIREELRILRRQKYDVMIKNEKTLPGVLNYFETARRLGLKIGLASSAPYDWVMPNLEELELVHYFDCIRTNGDVSNVKPDPELYLNVLEYFGVSPRNAIAFEDSPNGAQAARSADMHVVIVPNELTKDLHFADYSLRMNSMLDMGLQQLINVLNLKINS
ncbi:Phosphorylated carbohydrates phosphatase [Paenibacillus auburnensis]|uniref:Phosphorylated carbohydrates phosphatase n=1 Tax=Paenibacillus auburnensis TaxID=2905649 RepID=A0ABM9BU87_9BACL|nr:HAD-IA family hydrolase [Paenibacillus auburnensis]CAH1194110.1 Phosphorylated carbohydrates phosphatase [Paenibacillus auburnensis]